VASSGDVCIETADHTQKSDYHSTSTTTTTSDDGSEGPEAQEPGDDDYSPPSRYANSSGTSGTEEALTQDMTVDPFEHKLDKAMPWYRYFALRPCTQSKRDGFIKAIETAWPFVQHAMYLPRGIRPEELMVGSKLKNIKDWDTRLLRMRGELSALTRNDMPSAHASIAAAGGLRNEGDDTSMKTVLGILPIAKFSISEGPKMPVSGSSRPGVAGQQSPSSPLDRESREAGYKNERRGLPLVPESVAGSSRQLNTSAENTRLRCKSRDDYDNDQTMVARNGRMGMRENARIDNNGGHHKGRVEAISPNNFIQQHIDRIIADHSTSKELPQNAGISTAQRHVENIDVVLPARLSAASNARPLPPVGPSVWVWHNQKQFCTHWAMTRHCIYEVTSQGCRHPHVWPDEVTYRKQLPGIEFPPRWMRRSPELHRLCVEGTLVGWPTGDIDALTRAMDAQLPVQSRSALSNFHSAERASEPRQTPVTAPQPSQIGHSKGPSQDDQRQLSTSMSVSDASDTSPALPPIIGSVNADQAAVRPRVHLSDPTVDTSLGDEQMQDCNAVVKQENTYTKNVAQDAKVLISPPLSTRGQKRTWNTLAGEETSPTSNWNGRLRHRPVRLNI